MYDHDPHKNKLSDRAIKCVFLGYSSSQKGYKCFDPVTKRKYVSMDVKFFEDVPYFSNKGKSFLFDEPEPHNVVLPTLECIPDNIYLERGSTSVLDNATNDESTLELQQFDRPLQVYSRRTSRNPVLITSQDQVDSNNGNSLSLPSSNSPVVTDSVSSPSLQLLIALRKGKRSNTSRVYHPIENFISYHCFSPSHRAFIAAISSKSVPTSFAEASRHLVWKRAMEDEMRALEKNQTWELADLPKGKKPVGCRWCTQLNTIRMGVLRDARRG